MSPRGHRLPPPRRGRGPALGPPLGRAAPRLPVAGLARRPGRARPRGLPVDPLLRLRGLHRLRGRARGGLGGAAGRREPGHRAGSLNRGPGAGTVPPRRRPAPVRPSGRERSSRPAGTERGELRCGSASASPSSAGCVSPASADVARMWERALRRAGLPLAYTEGFSPRPQLSFGLALPTGCESLAEYLDVVLDEAGSETGGRRVRPRCRTSCPSCCPRASTWTPAAAGRRGAGVPAGEVTSCAWEHEVRGMLRRARAEARVASLLAADSVPVMPGAKGPGGARRPPPLGAGTGRRGRRRPADRTGRRTPVGVVAELATSRVASVPPSWCGDSSPCPASGRPDVGGPPARGQRESRSSTGVQNATVDRARRLPWEPLARGRRRAHRAVHLGACLMSSIEKGIDVRCSNRPAGGGAGGVAGVLRPPPPMASPPARPVAPARRLRVSVQMVTA